MRVCIPSLDPGGPDGVAAASFEETDVFDFYEVYEDGDFERVAQTRPCACWGPDQAEAISRRSIEAIVVSSMSSSALLKFRVAGVRVLKADNPSVAALLDSYVAGRLDELRIDRSAQLRKKARKD